MGVCLLSQEKNRESSNNNNITSLMLKKEIFFYSSLKRSLRKITEEILFLSLLCPVSLAEIFEA